MYIDKKYAPLLPLWVWRDMINEDTTGIRAEIVKREAIKSAARYGREGTFLPGPGTRPKIIVGMFWIIY